MTGDGTERSFIFADLSGFTAMTESHGDETSANTALRFADMAKAALSGGTVIVKTIGDAVMLAAPTPIDAVTTAVALNRVASLEPQFPLVRTGIHHGPCVERDRDFFGGAVNLAARVAGHARAGQILATASVIARLESVTGIDVRDAGLGHFKNIADPVQLYELAVVDAEAQIATTDPVCRMRVEPAAAVARIVHAGAPYYFCSESCAKTFLDAPEKHLPARRSSSQMPSASLADQASPNEICSSATSSSLHATSHCSSPSQHAAAASPSTITPEVAVQPAATSPLAELLTMRTRSGSR